MFDYGDRTLIGKGRASVSHGNPAYNKEGDHKGRLTGVFFDPRSGGPPPSSIRGSGYHPPPATNGGPYGKGGDPYRKGGDSYGMTHQIGKSAAMAGGYRPSQHDPNAQIADMNSGNAYDSVALQATRIEENVEGSSGIPHAFNTVLFKTMLCRDWPHCPRGEACTFAHGEEELRANPKYKMV